MSTRKSKQTISYSTYIAVWLRASHSHTLGEVMRFKKRHQQNIKLVRWGWSCDRERDSRVVCWGKQQGVVAAHTTSVSWIRMMMITYQTYEINKHTHIRGDTSANTSFCCHIYDGRHMRDKKNPLWVYGDCGDWVSVRICLTRGLFAQTKLQEVDRTLFVSTSCAQRVIFQLKRAMATSQYCGGVQECLARQTRQFGRLQYRHQH